MTHPPYPGPLPPAEDPVPIDSGVRRAPWRTQGLAVGAAIAATLVVLVDASEIPLVLAAGETYRDAAREGTSALDVWTAYDFAAIPWVMFMISAYLVTCLWLHGLRTNGEVVRPGSHHARSRVWVWLGWMVPIVSLWFPYQVVRDIWADSMGGKRPGAILGWWWAMWLIYVFTSQPGPALTQSEEIDTAAIGALYATEIVNFAFAVAALILWVVIIRQVQHSSDAINSDDAIPKARTPSRKVSVAVLAGLASVTVAVLAASLLHTDSDSRTVAPSSEASAPSEESTNSTEPVPPNPVTCWDGTPTTEAGSCRALKGLAAMKWGFPLAKDPHCTNRRIDDKEEDAYTCTWDDMPHSTVVLRIWKSSGDALKTYRQESDYRESVFWEFAGEPEFGSVGKRFTAQGRTSGTSQEFVQSTVWVYKKVPLSATLETAGPDELTVRKEFKKARSRVVGGRPSLEELALVGDRLPR